MRSGSACYIKGNDCVTRSIAGETIVVPVRNNVGDLDSIYTLNEVGSSIWRLIDGSTSVSQIVETVCEEYDVNYAEAERDVSAYLDDLQQAALIRRFDDR